MVQMNFAHEDSDDVMCRIFHEETEKMVTIITAKRETLGEDGPVVTHIADDRVIVLFSLEFVADKIEAAVKNNAEDFGEMAFTIGFSYIVATAMQAVSERFLNAD